MLGMIVPSLNEVALNMNDYTISTRQPFKTIARLTLHILKKKEAGTAWYAKYQTHHAGQHSRVGNQHSVAKGRRN